MDQLPLYQAAHLSDGDSARPVYSSLEQSQTFELHKAAAVGDITRLQSLLATEDYSANDRDKNGETPLHHAAAAGYQKVVEFLLESRASPLIQDDFKYTPVHKAAENGHTSIVQHIVSRYQSMANMTGNDGTSPLMLAARNGHAETAKILCQHGAFIDAVNDYNTTALHMAVAGGDPQTVKVLLEAGASVFVRSRDTGQETPLETAKIKKLVYAYHFQANNYAQIVTLLETAEAKQLSTLDD